MGKSHCIRPTSRRKSEAHDPYFRQEGFPPSLFLLRSATGQCPAGFNARSPTTLLWRWQRAGCAASVTAAGAAGERAARFASTASVLPLNERHYLRQRTCGLVYATSITRQSHRGFRRLRNRKSSGAPPPWLNTLASALPLPTQADIVRIDIAEHVCGGDAVIRLNGFACSGVHLLVDRIALHGQVEDAIAVSRLAEDAAIKTLADGVAGDRRIVRAITARLDVYAVGLGRTRQRYARRADDIVADKTIKDRRRALEVPRLAWTAVVTEPVMWLPLTS